MGEKNQKKAKKCPNKQTRADAGLIRQGSQIKKAVKYLAVCSKSRERPAFDRLSGRCVLELEASVASDLLWNNAIRFTGRPLGICMRI